MYKSAASTLTRLSPAILSLHSCPHSLPSAAPLPALPNASRRLPNCTSPHASPPQLPIATIHPLRPRPDPPPPITTTTVPPWPAGGRLRRHWPRRRGIRRVPGRLPKRHQPQPRRRPGAPDAHPRQLAPPCPRPRLGDAPHLQLRERGGIAGRGGGDARVHRAAAQDRHGRGEGAGCIPRPVKNVTMWVLITIPAVVLWSCVKWSCLSMPCRGSVVWYTSLRGTTTWD